MITTAVVRESGRGSGTTSPVAVTVTAGASGNTLVASISSNRGSSVARTVSSITQTNVTWAKVTGASGANGFLGVEIWLGTNVTGNPSGTSMSVAFSGTIASGACIEVVEASGILTSGTINDGSGVASTGTSTSPSTGAFSTTLGNDIVFSCVGYQSGTGPSAQPGGVWSNGTFQGSSTTCGIQANYAASQGIGAQSASWTIGATGDVWCTVICALRPVPTWIFKQASGNSNLSVSSIAKIITPSAIGNLLIVWAYDNSSSETFTISDTAGNTWSSVIGPLSHATLARSVQLWYAISKGTSATTITVGAGATTPYIQAIAAEFQGPAGLTLAPDTAVASATNATTSTSPVSLATTANVNDDLLFGVIAGEFGNEGVGSGFTLTVSPQGTADVTEHQLPFGTGSENVLFTFNTFPNRYCAFAVTFKAYTPAAGTTVFRKTLSPLGTRVGTRQAR